MEPFGAFFGTKCTPYLEARQKARSGVKGLKESDDVRKGYSNPLTLFQTKICDFPDPKFRPEQKFEALPLATTATTLCQMFPITQNSLD